MDWHQVVIVATFCSPTYPRKLSSAKQGGSRCQARSPGRCATCDYHTPRNQRLFKCKFRTLLGVRANDLIHCRQHPIEETDTVR